MSPSEYNEHSMPRSLMRSFLFVTFVLLDLPGAHGATISDFTIINSSDPNIRGGVFSGGGNYYGTFSIDTSLIPANGSAKEIGLASFDVFFAPQGQPTVEISSSSSDSPFGSLVVTNESQEFGLELQFDQLQFNLDSSDSLDLDLIEPAGHFAGGLVQEAQAIEFTAPPSTFTDSRGTALVIDPALVPEPSSMALLGVGAAVFAALKRRASRRQG
jgi:PEP-CTERM motif